MALSSARRMFRVQYVPHDGVSSGAQKGTPTQEAIADPPRMYVYTILRVCANFYRANPRGGEIGLPRMRLSARVIFPDIDK